jgi:hypothetical protein
MSNLYAPDDHGFPFDNVSKGAITTPDRRDVPPHGEGLETYEELRPRKIAEWPGVGVR